MKKEILQAVANVEMSPPRPPPIEEEFAQLIIQAIFENNPGLGLPVFDYRPATL